MTVATHGQTTVRVATVPAVLIAEYLCLFLVLAWRHDIDAVEALPGSWQGLLWAGSGFAGAMIAALGAFAVLWDGSIADRMRAALAGTRPVTGGSLSVHFASYAAFAGLTILILARPDVAADLGWPLLVLWLGVAVSVPTSLVIAVLGASTKAVLRAAGPHVALAAVLGTATGVAAVQILPYWRALSDPTLRLVTAMLEAAGFTVLVEPALPGIQLGDFGAHIGATCSGIEGMAMITVLLAGYLYRFREEHRFPQALLVFPAAIAISFVANAARIAILLWVGDRIDPQLAKGAFHSMAGWVFFCGISLGIIATLRRLPWMTRHLPVAPSLRDDSLEVTAYLLPFLVWLALSLVSAAFGHLGELAYGRRRGTRALPRAAGGCDRTPRPGARADHSGGCRTLALRDRRLPVLARACASCGAGRSGRPGDTYGTAASASCAVDRPSCHRQRDHRADHRGTGLPRVSATEADLGGLAGRCTGSPDTFRGPGKRHGLRDAARRMVGRDPVRHPVQPDDTAAGPPDRCHHRPCRGQCPDRDLGDRLRTLGSLVGNGTMAAPTRRRT